MRILCKVTLLYNPEVSIETAFGILTNYCQVPSDRRTNDSHTLPTRATFQTERRKKINVITNLFLWVSLWLLAQCCYSSWHEGFHRVVSERDMRSSVKGGFWLPGFVCVHVNAVCCVRNQDTLSGTFLQCPGYCESLLRRYLANYKQILHIQIKSRQN